MLHTSKKAARNPPLRRFFDLAIAKKNLLNVVTITARQRMLGHLSTFRESLSDLDVSIISHYLNY